jgi:hypothetical protein
MNLAVAVKAVFTQHVLVGGASRQPLAAIGLAGVESRRMALLAQGGSPGGQQGFIDRTMGSVTQGAVLCRWRVFPQERAAFVGVAAETVIVD